MNTSFKILFAIEVLHDFYENGMCADFKLIPTAATKKLLSNYNAIFKTVGNKLIVLVKNNEFSKPFIQPATSDKFCFYLELMNPVFMTISNLDLQNLKAKRFNFTNLYQNKTAVVTNDFLYLSKQVAAYQPLNIYSPGSLVVHSNEVFECIKQTAAGNAPAANSIFWMSRNKNQYASTDDLISFIPQQCSFEVLPVSEKVDVQVFKLNLQNNLFDELVLSQTMSFEEPVNKLSVDLTKLDEAKYKVLINGKEFLVYVSNDAVYSNMFGVIELYNHLPNGNDFSFFQGAPNDGKLKDRIDSATGKNSWLTFSIRFANRFAFWKYFTPGKGVQSIDTVPSNQFNANAIPADFFTSIKPIALKQKPYEFKLNLTRPISREPPLAPNPDINTTGMLTKIDADYFCNIYINY